MNKQAYLLSYPRSGNHWVRYIIEWFSGRPTSGDIQVSIEDDRLIEDDTIYLNPEDGPINTRCDMPHLEGLPIVKKRHAIRIGDGKNLPLILLIRDYKECVLRQLTLKGVSDISISNPLVKHELDLYLNLIRTYNSWYDDKLVIEYIDIKNPNEAIINRLLNFINVIVTPEKINLFLNNIEFHKLNAFSILDSKEDTSLHVIGDNYHSSKINQDILKEWDEYVEKSNTRIRHGYRLHLGCGPKHINDFTNIDARSLPGVDLVDDIQTLGIFKENEIDLIYVSHVLEHIGRREYMTVLQRWYDILKEGGTLRIAVPDFEKVVEHYNEYKNLEVLRGFLYGGQTYPQNYHYCAWDFKTLANDLETIGFKDVKPYDWRATEHSHIDDFSQCYLPHMDKENGKLMSLNVEATK
jgi:predicted SAM-dependent methyltransferase